MSDVYPPTHWAMVGRPPGYHTPDEAVFLPGRNIVLLGKAAIFCATAGVQRIVMGTLAHNPFPDATPEFRAAIAAALSLGLSHRLQIDAPYAELGKADVIRRGMALGVAFELTLSCMSPVAGRVEGSAAVAQHCGTCSKCRERHDAFVEAGIQDPTPYADLTFVGGS
jgi:7-cyano-7-deazaguanine synthase